MSVGRMGRWRVGCSIATCGVLAAVAAAPAVANAAGELDQKQEEGVGGGAGEVRSGSSFAQTFTAGKSGTLEKVELNLSQFGGVAHTPTQPITVEITEVNASGEPDTTKVLGSASFGPATLPNFEKGEGEWVPFNITAPSKAGTSYAIVASSSTPESNRYDWYTQGPNNPYAGGQEWDGTATPPAPPWAGVSVADMTFRTYVAAATATPPDLSLENRASPSPVMSGNTLTYTLTVTNTGGETADNVTLADELPESAAFGSVSTTKGTCNRKVGPRGTPKPKGGSVFCKLDSLEGGKTATITITVTPTKPGTVKAKATVKASNVTSDANDEETATTTVLGG